MMQCCMSPSEFCKNFSHANRETPEMLLKAYKGDADVV